MKKLALLFICILISSCNNQNKDISSIDAVNWNKRKVTISQNDSLLVGSTYLSVYSKIYSLDEHKTHNLTATISMRNINKLDTIFINKAEYFDTHGNAIRTYFDFPIFLKPMETVEIIINEIDGEGGTGGNFVFDWLIKEKSLNPYFEGIMISTSGQQGLSFATQGKEMQ